MSLTRFGFHFSSTSYADLGEDALFDRILDVARAAEQAGFDSIWVPDHVHQNNIGGGPGGPMLEAYTLLAALAARTETALLGALVSPVTFRHPALLAKQTTALDVISHGRAVLGIGAAWDVGEHSAYGISFPNTPEREDRLEEAVVLCQKMFAEQTVDYDGRYYSLEEAWNSPRPVQRAIPVLVGGGGEKRTLAVVAKYADACNFFGAPADIAHKIEVLKGHCEQYGRDFSEITTTCSLFPPDSEEELREQVAERLAVGVDGVVLFGRSCPPPSTVSSWGEMLHREFA
jgi:F420-dependent oxidoreductase-like protein